MSGKEKAAAQAQKAQDAFQSAPFADLLHKKLTGPLGTNAAGDTGTYQTATGQKVYVKELPAARAQQEHLANAIYAALGASVPPSWALTAGGKSYFVSLWTEHEGTLGSGTITKDTAKAALSHIAADMLLSNRDAAGLSLDNMAKAGGSVLRLDNGGSLEYRAQGQKKTQDDLDHLHEWNTLAPGGANPSFAKLFEVAGVKSMDQVPGLSGQILDIMVLAAQPGGWQTFIGKHVPGMPKADQKRLAGILQKRTDLLAAKREALLDTQGGSLEALAGATSLAGGYSKNATDWDKNAPLTKYRKEIVSGVHTPAVEAHFAALFEGHGIKTALQSVVSPWTGSSSGSDWHTAWPGALTGETDTASVNAAKVLKARRKRWEKLCQMKDLPFPETFHVYRGMSGEGVDADTHVVPWVVAAWRNEDEPYMYAKCKPASSWSMSQEKAEDFSGAHNGVVFETHVPFQQTISDMFADDLSFLTSFPHENEVVCGGQADSLVVPKSGVTVYFAGKKYGWEQRHDLFAAFKAKHGTLPAAKTFGIDLVAHQEKHLGKPKAVALSERQQGMADEDDGRTLFEMADHELTPEQQKTRDFLIGHNAQIAAFHAGVQKAGATPAPTTGVKPIGSFAEDFPEQHAAGEDKGTR